MRHTRAHYERDDQTWPADAYRVKGIGGVAWRVLGWETEPDEDTEWSGYEVRTDRVSIHMIGDDQVSHVMPDELVALEDLDYCNACGQIGCAHDGRSRDESTIGGE